MMIVEIASKLERTGVDIEFGNNRRSQVSRARRGMERDSAGE
jgi:hypothetical protein